MHSVWYRCIRLWRATWRDSVSHLRKVTGWFLTTLHILPSLLSLLFSSLCLFLFIALLFSNDALALSLRSVDALTLISVINWGDLLHSLCHPLWSSSMLPLSLLLPITPFFFLAHPFIKRWLPYLICILLISCCQSPLPPPLSLCLYLPLSSISATIWSSCQYESLAHLIKSYLMANWASVL